MDFKKVIYPELMVEMVRHGDNLKTIGKVINTTYASVSRKLAGISDWKLKEVFAISKYYNKSIEELFKGE